MKNSFRFVSIAVFLWVPCAWAEFGDPPPPVVAKLQQAFKSGHSIPDASLFAFPVSVYETAYEVGDSQCGAYYHKVSVKNLSALKPYLEQVNESWKADGQEATEGNDPGYYGTTTTGDCEHYSAVKVDKQKQKIIGFVVDASNNEWEKSRKEFNLKDLPK